MLVGSKMDGHTVDKLIITILHSSHFMQQDFAVMSFQGCFLKVLHQELRRERARANSSEKYEHYRMCFSCEKAFFLQARAVSANML